MEQEPAGQEVFGWLNGRQLISMMGCGEQPTSSTDACHEFSSCSAHATSRIKQLLTAASCISIPVTGHGINGICKSV